MRGALISPYAAEANHFSVLGPNPIEQALRNSLLYWDTVTFASLHRGMMPRLDRVADLLVNEEAGKCIYFDTAQFSSRELGPLAASFLDLVEGAQKRKGEAWSVVCPVGNYQYTSQFLAVLANRGSVSHNSKMQVLECAFLDALPTPPPDAEWRDIIQFKRRRTENLRQLHHAIDMLSVGLSGAADIADAIRVGKTEISNALNDIDRVLSEKWPKRLYRSVRASFGSIVVGGVGGALAASSFQFPLVIGAALGAAAKPMISAAIATVFAERKLPERTAPYMYAYEARREFQG
jgi:hypothetical protein